jgi:hypothetical protein
MGSIPAGLFDVLGAGNAGFQSGAHGSISTITVTAVYPGPRGGAALDWGHTLSGLASELGGWGAPNAADGDCDPSNCTLVTASRKSVSSAPSAPTYIRIAQYGDNVGPAPPDGTVPVPCTICGETGVGVYKFQPGSKFVVRVYGGAKQLTAGGRFSPLKGQAKTQLTVDITYRNSETGNVVGRDSQLITAPALEYTDVPIRVPEPFQGSTEVTVIVRPRETTLPLTSVEVLQ